MITEILIQFSKSTKRTTVFGTEDDLVPADDVYVNTAELLSRGIAGERLILSISDKPFTAEEAETIAMIVLMRISRTTKYKTLFQAVSADAPVDRIYLTSEWLQAHGFGDTLYIGISASPGADKDNDVATDPVRAFDEFLAATVIRRKGGLVNTDRIWTAWASIHGESPECDVIADISKDSVAHRFRTRFSPPPARHRRVDGGIHRCWEGFAIGRTDEA